MRDICDILNFQEKENLGLYLGIPLLQDKSKIRSYSYVLNKVKRRLSRWKRRCLSLARRTVLVRSVINVIPFYSMMVAKILTPIVNEIERHERAFIWSHEFDERKFHPIGWKDLIKEKESGGLGIRSLGL